MSLFAAIGEIQFKYADIILPLNMPQVLTYGVPHHMQSTIGIGMRVEISLGKNKQYAGIVDRLHNDTPEHYAVKPIKSIIDDYPIVNNLQLQFWRWIADYYMAAPGEVMQAALPAHLKLMAETSLQWVPGLKAADFDLSDDAYIVAEALEIKRELSLSQLKTVVQGKQLAMVINELLEKQLVIINDELESQYKPKTEKIIRIAESFKIENNLISLFNQLQKAPKQLSLIMAYTELSLKQPYVRQEDLINRAQSSAAAIKALCDKGIFIVEEQDVDRLQYKGDNENREIVFTPPQQNAYSQLEIGLQEKNVALLQGVTGSGKTLLYINKIKTCLQEGKQAIFLLPEIALTTQLVNRLYAFFGEELGVYHSRFSNNERVEIWEKVLHGKYKIVVGPRSVLWLPFNNLGLIVVDEEHDGSYKQKDPAPRFHARDAAIYLASLHQAKVILGSATPSVESLYNAQQKKYAYVLLTERYMGVNLPAIQIVNAKSLETMRTLGVKQITPELQEAMLHSLQQRKQVILFQNRRGYAPFQVCMVCGWVPQCKNCAVSLTYHKSTDKLHCHYCGQHSAIVHTCQKCGSNRLISKSFGTERIEEEVQQLFPQIKVARMDVDSMKGKQSMPDLFRALEQQKVDVLVGTQMVVKGLDLPTVNLVGILSADSLLSFPDFRVNERAFQLMEQVSGRAGRADGAGRVLIQAYNTEHPVLKWVQQHDVQAFYNEEIKFREYFAYPPFTRLVKIMCRHKDENKAIAGASHMAKALQAIQGIIIQGPVPALIPRVRNNFIWEIWLKCPRDNKLINGIKVLMKEEKQLITSQRGLSQLQIIFDVDPV
jgi:primosomal protein N' (replication factor Y)